MQTAAERPGEEQEGCRETRKSGAESVRVAAKKLLVWVDGRHLSDAE